MTPVTDLNPSAIDSSLNANEDMPIETMNSKIRGRDKILNSLMKFSLKKFIENLKPSSIIKTS